MDPYRKFWNEQQKALQEALSRSGNHQKAIELFLSQHAMVHSVEMASSEMAPSTMDRSRSWSFEEEIWRDTSEEAIRRIPKNSEQSIAWIFWHIARIEDVTMNLLVAGNPQLLNEGNWLERMKVEICETGNGLDAQGIEALSASIDIVMLRAYRTAVGRRTREIVQQLHPDEMNQKVASSRLKQVVDEGVLADTMLGLIDYWGSLKIAGLLLMPPTRHNFIHLNEALRLKHKRR
ncbi:MAG: DinB family protein [Omnitrophica WOR_2 bacterium]